MGTGAEEWLAGEVVNRGEGFADDVLACRAVCGGLGVFRVEAVSLRATSRWTDDSSPSPVRDGAAGELKAEGRGERDSLAERIGYPSKGVVDAVTPDQKMSRMGWTIRSRSSGVNSGA